MYKRILLEHLNNCRDLGGYSCAKGEMIGYQRLYRSEAPDHLEDWEWDIIEKMGVKQSLISVQRMNRDLRLIRSRIS